MSHTQARLLRDQHQNLVIWFNAITRLWYVRLNGAAIASYHDAELILYAWQNSR